MSGDSYRRDAATKRKERAYEYVLLACAAVTVLVTVGIILSLLGDSLVFFRRVSVVSFLTGTRWEPQIQPHSFGVLPLISGTLIVTVGSAIISLPVGLAAAIYLSEYASDRVRAVLKPALEILAGVPTVVYGYFALVYITPALRSVLPLSVPVAAGYTLVVPKPGTFNALSASIVVGIMIIPMVSSISEDALSAVPDSLREAGYGLGSTKFDVSTKVVVPAAVSGIVSSYVLAISRAIGETMAVTIAAGQSPQMPYVPNVLLNLTESIETITAAMVEIAFSDIQGESTAYYAMFALGLTLFVITFSMNLLAEYVRARYREVYG
ncbi:MAG: phosphate ABC transporter permease subunit PstC [Halobacteriales archaeon]